MHFRTDQLITGGGYIYLASLLASVWFYGSRKSKIARYVLAILIFVPAGVCLYGGLVMLAETSGGDYTGGHGGGTPAAAAAGLAPIIALFICALGVLIAAFGVRVLIKPIKPRKDDDKA